MDTKTGVQLLQLNDTTLENVVQYLPWKQQYVLSRVSNRFKTLKYLDKETHEISVFKEKIPDDGQTILKVLKLLPNLRKLYDLDRFKTRGQFFYFNDVDIVGAGNGTETLLAMYCPKIVEWHKDWNELDYQVVNP